MRSRVPGELAPLWVLWLTHCCQVFCPSYLEIVNFVLFRWMKLHAKCWLSTVSREYRRGKVGVVFNKRKAQTTEIQQELCQTQAASAPCAVPQRPPPSLLLQGLPACAPGASRSPVLRQTRLWLPPHSSVHVCLWRDAGVHVPASMSPAQPVHVVGVCWGDAR